MMASMRRRDKGDGYLARKPRADGRWRASYVGSDGKRKEGADAFDAAMGSAERSAAAAPLDWDTLMKGAEIGHTYGALGREFAQILPELRRLSEGTDR